MVVECPRCDRFNCTCDAPHYKPDLLEVANYVITTTGDVNAAWVVQGLSSVATEYLQLTVGEASSDEAIKACAHIKNADEWGGDFFHFSETYEDGSFSVQRITQ